MIGRLRIFSGIGDLTKVSSKTYGVVRPYKEKYYLTGFLDIRESTLV